VRILLGCEWRDKSDTIGLNPHPVAEGYKDNLRAKFSSVIG
jgi:hypothetical protein